MSGLPAQEVELQSLPPKYVIEKPGTVLTLMAQRLRHEFSGFSTHNFYVSVYWNSTHQLVLDFYLDLGFIIIDV
jgi:hypothetical protein